MLPEPDSYLTLSRYIKLLQNKETPPFNETTMKLVYHIVKSILSALENKSNIDPNTKEGKEILEFEGYTGTKTRHFYNNICSELENINYLEIGTWKGSSSISAVYKNKINGLFIDNWCQFGGNVEDFVNVISKYCGDSDCAFIEDNCWDIDLETLDKKFNVYLFDGDHAELDHYKALEYYLPVLDDEFIFLVDDWNWPNVRDGTMRAINELDLIVEFRHEEFVSGDELKGMPNHKGKQTWWNGIGIFLLKKSHN